MKETLPIFLVGSYRSGTNMTVWALERSPEVTLYNENNPIAFDNFYLRDKHIIHTVTRETETPIALYKPISDTWKARLFLSEYPDCKVLYIYRKVEDMIRSFVREFGDAGRDTIENVNLKRIVDGTHQYFTEYPSVLTGRTKEYIKQFFSSDLDYNSLIALFWLFQNRLYIDLELYKEPKVMLLNYETLVEDPKSGFANICEYIKIQYTDDLVPDIKKSDRWNFEVPINEDIKIECDRLYNELLTYLN